MPLFGESVVHTRRVQVGRNAHGQPIYEDRPQPPIHGASLQDPSSVEPATDGSLRVITSVVLYVPAGTVVKPLDKIAARGVTYEVQGESLGQINAFTGTAGYIPVKLKRVSG